MVKCQTETFDSADGTAEEGVDLCGMTVQILQKCKAHTEEEAGTLMVARIRTVLVVGNWVAECLGKRRLSGRNYQIVADFYSGLKTAVGIQQNGQGQQHY